MRGGPPGCYALKAIPFSQFPGGDKASNGGPVPNQTVLTVRSAGTPRARLPAQGRSATRWTCAAGPSRANARSCSAK